MDELQIEAFLYVVRTRNFSRAAKLLHVTQSTVTSRVKGLENQFGKPLLYRTTRHVELTRFGTEVLPHLTKISEVMSESLQLAHITDKYDNFFSVSMIESAGYLPIVRTLDMIQGSFPSTSVHLMTAASIDVAQAVIDGTVDLGLVYSLPRHPSIVTRRIHTDEIVLVSNPALDFPEQPLTQGDIKPQYLVRIDWSEHFTKWFSSEFGPNLAPGTEVANTNLALQIVLSGKRFGFFPKSLIRPFVNNNSLHVLRYNPSQPIPQRMIYAISQKTSKQAVLVDYFSKQLESMVEQK